MSALPNGTYRTAAGSRVTIDVKRGGIVTIDFDWFEEEGACFDCEPGDIDDGFLVWTCDRCGGERAELIPVSADTLKGDL